MMLHLTWLRMWVLTGVTAVIATVTVVKGSDAINTAGINLLTGAGVCVVAAVMTTRTVRANGWSPRVFLFTWWMWMIGFRFVLLSWQSHSELTAPPDALVLAARAAVWTATVVLLLVLVSRPAPPDEVDNLVSRGLLLEGDKGSQWR